VPEPQVHLTHRLHLGKLRDATSVMACAMRRSGSFAMLLLPTRT
jgi:hypothetical protein